MTEIFCGVGRDSVGTSQVCSPAHVQRLAAGGEDFQLTAALAQIMGDVRTRLDKMFAVIQDQEQMF
jgi:hypothetical protein